MILCTGPPGAPRLGKLPTIGNAIGLCRVVKARFAFRELNSENILRTLVVDSELS